MLLLQPQKWPLAKVTSKNLDYETVPCGHTSLLCASIFNAVLKMMTTLETGLQARFERVLLKETRFKIKITISSIKLWTADTLKFTASKNIINTVHVCHKTRNMSHVYNFSFQVDCQFSISNEGTKLTGMVRRVQFPSISLRKHYVQGWREATWQLTYIFLILWSHLQVTSNYCFIWHIAVGFMNSQLGYDRAGDLSGSSSGFMCPFFKSFLE